MKQSQIDTYVQNGSRVVPVFTHSQKDYNKMVLEYRLYVGKDTFYKITRYQAKKHLINNDQIDIVNRFEDILKENRDMRSMPFGRQLDIVNSRKKARENDIQLDTMLKCIEEMQYTEFN